MEVHFLSDNDRKHSAWFTWELCMGAKSRGGEGEDYEYEMPA